jgi:LPS export ABC transporter protein LptC
VFFIIVALGFLMSMASLVYLRSVNRTSVLRNMISARENSSLEDQQAKGADKSELHLQEFRRVEVKGGRKMWEIRARDAKYFIDQGVTQVNDASLRVYRKNSAPIDLQAHAAKLFIEADALRNVELEGDIVVSDNESFKVQTDLASFDVGGGVLKSPSLVHIKGPGYEVEGVGMQLKLSTQQLQLQQQVKSVFRPGAKTPSGLNSLVN